MVLIVVLYHGLNKKCSRQWVTDSDEGAGPKYVPVVRGAEDVLEEGHGDPSLGHQAL
jgi:hypothetical protein